MNTELESLSTERRNEHTKNLDHASTIDILTMMNQEDLTVAMAVQKVLEPIKTTVDLAYESIKEGGRLIYIGAGTSGRLGVLDAAECPPTFSTSPELVRGIIAGGKDALLHAIEGAEDKEEYGAEDLKKIGLTSKDTVVGIAASGRTPYVIGALKYAKSIGANTAALSSNKDSLISKEADTGIEVETGPEVLTGSTRLKAATGHKMVLNMISTAVMVKAGKVYENLMVDVHVSNYKLKNRAVRMIQTVAGADHETAVLALDECGLNVKQAIVMLQAKIGAQKAGELLDQADGDVRKAVELSNV